jgi:hypothetical protein
MLGVIKYLFRDWKRIINVLKRFRSAATGIHERTFVYNPLNILTTNSCSLLCREQPPENSKKKLNKRKSWVRNNG